MGALFGRSAGRSPCNEINFHACAAGERRDADAGTRGQSVGLETTLIDPVEGLVVLREVGQIGPGTHHLTQTQAQSSKNPAQIFDH